MFTESVAALALACAALHASDVGRLMQQGVHGTPAFSQFRRTFLSVYLLALASDWLQGPYVYALYENYGMTKRQIEVLFVAGFGSSLVFGTIAGSLADTVGRRRICLLYGATYAVSCVTKHFNDFGVLFFGRVLAGIATSILFSVFESWMVCEHNKKAFGADLLSDMFSIATFGNSLLAILSGLVANYVAHAYGYVAPFDASLVLLVVMMAVIAVSWDENYGNQRAGFAESFGDALSVVRTDKRVTLLGLIQSLFEAAMYMFVLMWTPALAPKGSDDEEVPHGNVFAAFMIMVMCGSAIFSRLIPRSAPEAFMTPVFAVAACALAVPAVSKSQSLIYASLLVFEGCIGIFWPAVGTMRSRYIPEETRASVMNIFRVPLNIIVVAVLLQDFSVELVFGLSAVLLCAAAALQLALHRLTAAAAK